MSWIRLFGPARSRLHAVVDVGSHSIKAIAFEPQSGRAPRVVKKFATHLAANATPARRVVRLRELLSALAQKIGEIPGRVVVAIGPHLAEYSFGYWRTERSIGGGGIARADAGRMFQQLLEAHRAKSRLAMAYPVEIRANGYPATMEAMVSGDVKEIGFATLLMQFPEDVGNALVSVPQSVGGMPIEFVPLPVAYLEALTRADIRDGILLDIDGEETTGMLVRGGALRQVMTFPIGAHHFLRSMPGSRSSAASRRMPSVSAELSLPGMARAVNVSFEDTERMLRGYVQGMDDGARRAAIHAQFQKEADEWQKGFIDALDEWYAEGPLPSSVLLTGGGAAIPEIADALRNPSWLVPFSHAASVSLRVWDGPAIFGGSSLKGMLVGPEDAGLAALIVYSMYRQPLF